MTGGGRELDGRVGERALPAMTGGGRELFGVGERAVRPPRPSRSATLRLNCDSDALLANAAAASLAIAPAPESVGRRRFDTEPPESVGRRRRFGSDTVASESDLKDTVASESDFSDFSDAVAWERLEPVMAYHKIFVQA